MLCACGQMEDVRPVGRVSTGEEGYRGVDGESSRRAARTDPGFRDAVEYRSGACDGFKVWVRHEPECGGCGAVSGRGVEGEERRGLGTDGGVAGEGGADEVCETAVSG